MRETIADAWGREKTGTARAMAMAYVWGRQDAGESDRDTGYSQAFAAVYGLAWELTDGYFGPLQAAHHEWTATGRVLVQPRGYGTTVFEVRVLGDTLAAESHPIPWADTSIPWWPGRKGQAL